MTVYLLHLEQPLSDNHTCQHYMGSAEDLETRLYQHLHYPDARMMQVVKERGIRWMLARTWPGGRIEERRLKNWKNGPKLCPVCQGKKDFDPIDDLPF